MKRIFIVFIFVFSLSLFAQLAENRENNETKNILILASFHSTQVWTNRLVNTIQNDCKKKWYINSVSVVTFDMMRIFDEDACEKKLLLYLKCIRDGKYDMVVILDSPIIKLFLKHYSEMPRSVPVIFGGYENVVKNIKGQYPNITGVVQEIKPGDTLRAGLELYPLTKKVLIFSDGLPDSIVFEKKAEAFFQQYPNVQFEFESLQTQPIEGVFEKIAAMPKDSLLMLVPWHGLVDNHYQTLDAFSLKLSHFAKHPYLINDISLFGNGAVGGVVTDPVQYGKRISELIFEVHQKGSADDVPITSIKNTLIIDWRILKENKLNCANISQHYLLMNRPKSFWQKHSLSVFLMVVTFVIFLVAMCVALYLMWKHLKFARRIMDLLPGKIGIINAQEDLLLFSGVVHKDQYGAMKLANVPNIDYDRITPAVSEVFRDHRKRKIEFFCGNTRQIMYLVPFGKHLFSQQTALLFLLDNGDYQDTKDRVNFAYKQFDAEIKLMDSAVFQYNPANRKIIGSDLLLELLPIHHGCLDEVDQWIYKEDLPNAMQKWKHLLEKRKDSEKLYYRVQDGKDFLYYSACLYVEYDENMNLYVNGIIQNITKFYLHFQNYNDQTKFNDMVIDTIPCDFFIKNADDSFRYVACNQSFAEYLELEIHDVIGKTDAEIFSNSKDISEFAVKDQHILNFDGAETFEQTVTDNNKLKRVFLIVKKLFVDQSRRHLLVGIRSEITNQKHVLEAEKIKNKLLCAVGEDTTIVAKFTSISKILMEKLLTDRILLTKCRKDGMLRFEDEWLTSGINSICNIDIEKFYDIWDNRMAEIYSNIVFSDENISKNKWYAELNKNKDFRAQNIMVVPIFAKEKLWGCYFLFFLHQLHEYKDVEQQIMSFCADIVSTMVVKEEQQKILNQKKEQQQLILSTIDIPICLYDGERNLLRANSATCNLLNVPQERMTANLNNKLFAEFFRPEKFQPLNGMIAKESKAEKNINYNGRDYKMITEPVFNNMGHLIYIVKAAIDVTANNKFIARQSAIRQALVILLRGNETKDALGYAMRVLGFNLNVSRVAMFKYSGGVEKRVSCYVEEAINGGKKIFENVKEKPFDDKSDWYERFRYQTTIFLRDTKNISSSFYDKYWFDLIEKTNIRSMYATRVLVNSSLWGYICVTFEGTPHPLNDEEIRLLETFAHFFEVFFEREIISKKLEDALDAAKEVNKTKSFFFASVSHEIRTPLNAILGFTELLVNSTFDRNTTKDYLNSINYAGKSLMQLINDVLDLSKLESDRMIINPVDTDLSGLCKDVVSVFKYSSEKNNIELSSDIPKMPYLLIDPSRIRQILFNLLSNAMKFTKKGSVKLVVKYTQNSKETIDLELAVIDTGIGISAEDCKRIMEPYVQVNRMQETSGNKGSGLGLSITKRIVEKMGGNFIIKSVPEKGSKFIVKVPDIFVAQQNIDSGKEPVRLVENSSKEIIDQSILIVDDVLLNLKVMKAMCIKAGLKDIVIVNSGKEALNQLKNKAFDLVLTDMWMPEMSGDQLAEEIRKHAEYDSIRVFLVTADVEAKVNYNLSNFAGIILKPVTLDKVNKILQCKSGFLNLL